MNFQLDSVFFLKLSNFFPFGLTDENQYIVSRMHSANEAWATMHARVFQLMARRNAVRLLNIESGRELACQIVGE